MATRESRSLPGETSCDSGLAWTLAALVSVWFLLVLVAASRNIFIAGPSQPPLPLLVAIAAQEAAGFGDAPWPPHYTKQRDEPPRVAPSRRRPG